MPMPGIENAANTLLVYFDLESIGDRVVIIGGD